MRVVGGCDDNFVWRLGGFTTLRERTVYSDTFTAGGFNWRILCYPWGNFDVDDLSLYLEMADSKQLPVCFRDLPNVPAVFLGSVTTVIPTR